MATKGDKAGLSGELAAIRTDEKKIHLVLRIHNEGDRAMHYISDVRTLRYDPATRELTVSLSDEGRQIIPGAANKLPRFRHVDPGADAELHLEVPRRIVRLSRSMPPGQLGFESQQLTDAVNVVVNLAYADVPYYPDTRDKARDVLPAVQWQQDKLVLAGTYRSD